MKGVTAGGLPLGVRGLRIAPTIEIDTFDRDDGPIGNGWEDAQTFWPTVFDAAQIVDSQVYELPLSDDVPRLGHVVVARDIDFTDDFEVGISAPFLVADDIFGQYGPAIFMDLEAEDPLQMGVALHFDIGVFRSYLQNVFRTTDPPAAGHGDDPMSDVLDAGEYYRIFNGVNNDDGIDTRWPRGSGFPVRAGDNRVVLRVRNGEMRGYWNENPLGPKTEVPDWCLTDVNGNPRTKAGFQIISIVGNIGDPNPLTGDPIEGSAEIIDSWWCRPFIGELT